MDGLWASKISSEKKVFCWRQTRPREQVFHWTKIKWFHHQLHLCLRRQSWATCHAAGLSSAGTWCLLPCAGPAAAVGSHELPRFLRMLNWWDSWLFWGATDTKGQQPSTVEILLLSHLFPAGKSCYIILPRVTPPDPTASVGTHRQPCGTGRQHRHPQHRAAQTDPRHERLQSLYTKQSFRDAKILIPTKK